MIEGIIAMAVYSLVIEKKYKKVKKKVHINGPYESYDRVDLGEKNILIYM